MHSPLRLCAVALGLSISVAAQISVVVPTGFDTVEGNSNNAYPWNLGSTSMRIQFLHDSSNFTTAASSPVLIQQLRYRADDWAGTWSGGSWSNVRIDMATAAVDYASASATFAANLGPNLMTVLNGPVTVMPGTSNGIGVPGPFYIDIPLTTPFLYDPTQGDLVVDIHVDGSGWSGQSAQTDSEGSGSALSTRVYSYGSTTSATGFFDFNYGPVCEFTFIPASGYAYSTSYGSGCIDRASATFYEQFGNGTFDLSNTAWQFIPTGNGYAVLPVTPSWFTPAAATISLSDDSVSTAQPLGFSLPYPGGSTTDVHVSSNGFIWAQTNSDHGCCNGDPTMLRSFGARWCPLWNDLDPTSGGTVRFDTDAASGAAYVTFDQVVEYGTQNPNTFQVAFFSNGTVEFRYQSCTVQNHQVLTGWSPGTNNLDPGPIDISAASIILTEPDLQRIVMTANGRPVIGSSLQLETTNVPTGGIIGATLFGLTEINPGLDLTSLGMPGCHQYTSIDGSVIWIPAGGMGSTTFNVPNNPGLAGVEIKTQGVALVPGINALGALSTNGIKMLVDVN